jgi:hypothetical protein
MLPIHSFVGDSGLPLRGADSVSKPNLVSTVVLIDVVNRRRFAIHPNGRRHVKEYEQPHHSNSNVGEVENHYAVRQAVLF